MQDRYFGEEPDPGRPEMLDLDRLEQQAMEAFQANEDDTRACDDGFLDLDALDAIPDAPDERQNGNLDNTGCPERQ